MTRSITRRQALQGMAALSAASFTPAALASPSPLLVAGEAVELTLTSIRPRTLRVTLQRLSAGSPEPLVDDGVLALPPSPQAPVRLRSLAHRETFRYGELKVTLSLSPLTLRIEQPDGVLLQQLTIDDSSGELFFNLGNAPLLGLGQGGPQFDRRGSFDRMVSGQAGYQLGTHGARVPIQLLLGTEGWGLFVHAPLGSFDLRGAQGRLRTPADGSALPLDLFVLGETGPAALLTAYAAITGLPEMPPLWSLGYQQSYRTLGTREEILQEAKTFRDKQLPCDTLIYLGTGFCPEGWNTANGDFTWNSQAFPHPAEALATLHAEHFRVALHIVLEGQKLTGTVHDPCTAAPLPSGTTPDHHWPPDRQVSCYWPFHKPLVDLGVDGWWPDQGDGLDAPSRLARNRMYFEGQQLYRPNQRVFALHRNAYAGMARYAAFLWSGDVLSRWETLKTHVPNAINTGLSGMPFWGTDIGGFIPTQEYTGELYARWFQFAAFCPLFRSHGRDWKLHRPWGWNTGDLGFPETPGYHPDPAELHNPSIEPVCRKYLELRYRLLPYIYSAVRQTCETGLPIVRALWLHYPDDAAAVARGDQYLFGPDILVAPVVEKAATHRTLYLPRGQWIDLWTGNLVEGGRELTQPVDLSTMPLFVRAGAVLPTDPVRQYTAQPVDRPTTLTVYPGADGVSTLYSDDGETFNYRRGQFASIRMSWNDRRRELILEMASGSRLPAPGHRQFELRIAGQPLVKTITFQGRRETFTLA